MSVPTHAHVPDFNMSSCAFISSVRSEQELILIYL